jgi:hypothetical protein
VSPEIIRSRALECMRLAQNTNDPQHRSVLLSMAHSWAELANSAEQFQGMVERAERASRTESVFRAEKVRRVIPIKMKAQRVRLRARVRI